MAKKLSKNIDHIRFAVLAVDVVLFAIREKKLHTRLIDVNRPPAFPKGSKGFPGGLIHPKETAKESAMRILDEKADISPKKVHIEQLHTFSKVDRDPRGRVVAVSYIALVPWEKLSKKEKNDSDDSWWSKIGDAKALAYDHDEILKVAQSRLKVLVSSTTLIGKILPAKFTLGELERAYECILGEQQDKRNFRKKIAKLKVLKEIPGLQTGEAFRPAKLYKFKSNDVKNIELI